MLFGLEIAQTRNFLADDSVRTRGVQLGLEPGHDRRGHEEDRRHVPHREDARPVGDLDARRRPPHASGAAVRSTKADIVPHYFNDYPARALRSIRRRNGLDRSRQSVRGRERPHAVPPVQEARRAVLAFHRRLSTTPTATASTRSPSRSWSNSRRRRRSCRRSRSRRPTAQRRARSSARSSEPPIASPRHRAAR